ncbi:MAG: hypothetical protein IVW36_05515 [Dehalococcoidia bacterium]|nr:hypothetical protein [Dehalococcoidia bacterium]
MTMPPLLRRREPVRLVRIWMAYLTPPIAWSGHLLIIYLFASFTCAYGGTATVRVLIALTTAIALGLIIAAGRIAYTEAQELGALSWTHEEGRIRSRGFLVRSAIYSSVLFAIATLFEAAPAFALQGCR